MEPSGKRIVELDGLRGVAILLVLFGHYCSYILPKVEFFEFASLGVDVFFVLSGFLIGGIILDGEGAQGFLGAFYRRRAARILPIYVLVIAAAFAAQALAARQPWMDRLESPFVYLAFLSNFALAHLGRTGLLLNPTWSLAIEEQFYLLMPFVIMAVPRRSLPWVLGALCVVAIVLRALWSSNIAAVEVLLPCRMDALLLGVGAAFAQRRFELRRHVTQLLAAALVPIALYVLLVAMLGRGAAPFTHTAYAAATALFLLAVVNGLPSGGGLRAPWLRFFGEISYGLYLIHEPVRILLTGAILGTTIFVPGPGRVPVTLLAATVAVALATLSWRYFEKPVIQWAARRRLAFAAA
jgi:peptidoglycan/LPS O-acetylase OafA/YrhL